MVYPPDWRTLPVSIFTLTDRARVFDAAAETLLLLAASLVVLTVPRPAHPRRRDRTVIIDIS